MESLRQLSRAWTELLDPRVIDMPLVQSSYQMPLIILSYLYFVLRCGPRFMKNREPYSLKTFMIWYNLIQIISNAWLVYYYIEIGIFSHTKIICETKADFSFSPRSVKLARAGWFYFFLKILDFVDTIIYVLRKKTNQVTILHLYHHVSTAIIGWLVIRYTSIGQMVLMSMLNCTIHVVMYTYYLLASRGPKIQKIVAKMKQWVTIMQMVQLGCLILYVSQNFIPACHILPNWFVMCHMANLMFNFYNFYNFYQKAYKKPKKKV